MSKNGIETLMEDLEKKKISPREQRQALAKYMQISAQESRIDIHLDGVALAAEGKTGLLFGLLANVISIIAYRSDMSIDDALDKIQFYLDQNR